jgi:hypothetical protein
MSLAATFDALARHTYTRTPVTATPGDEANYYEETEAPGVAVPAVRCRFQPKTQVDFAAIGALESRDDLLHVFPDDPLAAGDLVSDVRDQLGRVLLAGPARVSKVDDVAGIGSAFKRVASLVSAEEVG